MAEEKKWKRKKLEELPLGDTFMFNKVFSDEPLMRRFLEKALGKTIGEIQFIETEKALDPELGLKPIRMDIFIQEENQNINVEMQTHNLGPLPQRGRWYKTTYDKSLRAAEEYEDIKPFYIIFICDYDIIELKEKSGYARYTRKSYLEENMVPAEDGYHLIVFNTRYKKDELHTRMVDSEILELLDYIRTDDDSATYQGDLANKSRDAGYYSVVKFVRKMPATKGSRLETSPIKGAVGVLLLPPARMTDDDKGQNRCWSCP